MEKRPAYSQIMRASLPGLHFAITIIVGGVIGYFLDKWLGTGPWFLIAFFFLGVIAAFRDLFRMINRESGEEVAPPPDQSIQSGQSGTSEKDRSDDGGWGG
jgi:ATP synthase protein I